MLKVGIVILVIAFAYSLTDAAPDKRCLSNQEWLSCGSSCPLNCENYQNPPQFCTMNCVIGCFCKEPYIFRSGKSGPCVLPRQCSRKY
ncbi:venom peptide SjAPI-2-like [Spea bombifrons]|uniref:venom peptide SjAPI-2-like n=1 Tax=Spea bombifrons TaxID=233779 RepID=UPI0023498F77|nr:venom peptide SjAPI-2-like [Spea bombifrons]